MVKSSIKGCGLHHGIGIVEWSPARRALPMAPVVDGSVVVDFEDPRSSPSMVQKQPSSGLCNQRSEPSNASIEWFLGRHTHGEQRKR
jgi:hypothetical protein